MSEESIGAENELVKGEVYVTTEGEKRKHDQSFSGTSNLKRNPGNWYRSPLKKLKRSHSTNPKHTDFTRLENTRGDIAVLNHESSKTKHRHYQRAFDKYTDAGSSGKAANVLVSKASVHRNKGNLTAADKDLAQAQETLEKEQDQKIPLTQDLQI